MRRMRNVFGIDAYVTGGKKEAKDLAAFIDDQVGMVAEDVREPEREDSPSAERRRLEEEGADLFGDYAEEDPGLEGDAPARVDSGSEEFEDRPVDMSDLVPARGERAGDDE